MSGSVAASVDTLIIVCCHAVYLGEPSFLSLSPADESGWLIEPFQSGETRTFIKHIEEGLRQLVLSKGKALLVFSGGATKQSQICELKENRTIGPWVRERKTEAQSYYEVAEYYNFFGYFDSVPDGQSLRNNVCLDPFATDSYQNILLPLMQWPILQHLHANSKRVIAPLCARSRPPPTWSTTAHLVSSRPRNVIIISHEFKRARFVDLHAPAVAKMMSLWFPDESKADRPAESSSALPVVSFVGFNPPFDEVKMREIEEGDRKRGYGVWHDDIYGSSELLSGKRLQRGWDEEAFIGMMVKWFGPTVRSNAVSIVRGLVRE